MPGWVPQKVLVNTIACNTAMLAGEPSWADRWTPLERQDRDAGCALQRCRQSF
jgi:hypothetical protein